MDNDDAHEKRPKHPSIIDTAAAAPDYLNLSDDLFTKITAASLVPQPDTPHWMTPAVLGGRAPAAVSIYNTTTADLFGTTPRDYTKSLEDTFARVTVASLGLTQPDYLTSPVSILSPTTLDSLGITHPDYLKHAASNSIFGRAADATLSITQPDHLKPAGSIFSPLTLDSLSIAQPNYLARAESVSVIANAATLSLTQPSTIDAFRMPLAGEISGLASVLPTTAYPGVLGHQSNTLPELITAATSIHAPWVQRTDPLLSLTGFAHLATMGAALNSLEPYSSKLTNLLRTELGDWRDPIDWSKTDLLDPLKRSALYVDRGLNLDLVYFPRAAFVGTMAAAGLADNVQDEVELDDDELALIRTNKAHDRLQRFEIRFRKFIAKQMQTVCGDKWLQSQVPGVLYQSWIAKRDADLARNGTARPAIDYADFSHYVQIIARKDNWDRVFKRHFPDRRVESVQESLQRLYPIRNGTMHARPITPEDELYLHAETTRLLKLIS